jgi:hypothetical protein
MRKFLGATIFVITCGAAHAEEPLLPLYDVDAQCAKIIDTPRVASGFSGPPVYVPTPKGVERDGAIKECVFAEQKAYDTLKNMWEGILPITRNRCIPIATKISSYQMLDNCITMYWSYDVDAAARAVQGKFKP